MSSKKMSMEHERECMWTIVKTVDETPRVKNLYLESQAERPDFTAGQYLTVKLRDRGPAEGKAYSIASAPHEPWVRLSIKEIGAFSEALRAHEVGDTVVTTTPYGFFYPEKGDTAPLVFIAGGIGITPCLAIIQDLLYQGDPRPVVLHYSNQTKTEVAFFEELKALAHSHQNLKIHYYLTREQSKSDVFVPHRMSSATILASVDSCEDVDFFICGSMHFTKALWKDLHEAGVPQHQLYTEGFF